MTVRKIAWLASFIALLVTAGTAETLVNLSTTAPQILLRGGAPEDHAGSSVTLGDFNDDGIDDMLVGAADSDGPGRADAGRVYMLLGSDSFSPNLALTMAQVNMNITFTGAASDDGLGTSTAQGDVNGDGIADMIMSAPQADPDGRTNAGIVYVLFGSPVISSQNNLDFASVNPSVRIFGPSDSSQIGTKLASGDVNDDGVDDIIIGASADDSGAGRVYVIYGSNSFSPPALINLATTPADVEVMARDGDDALGSAVASGDLNDDDIDDLIMGAPHAEGPNHFQTQSWGEAYVFYGSSSLASTIELATDTPDIEVRGGNADDELGADLATIDFNGDGIDDLVVGAPRYDVSLRQDVGAVFVYYGGTFGANAVKFGNTSNAFFTVLGDTPQDLFGMSLAGGDTNGDGIDDLVIGAPYGDYFFKVDRGKTYVVQGRNDYPTSFVYDLDLAEAFLFAIGAATNDLLGTAVAAGDVDGDGLAEVATSAPFADPENLLDKGAVYILSEASYAALDAELISANIPQWWYVGEKHYVSVSFKNTGSTPWRTGDTIQLAAIDDADPLAGSIRFNLPNSPILHGEIATFMVEMTAPSNSGVFTTDWRMIDGGGTLFGETLVQDVFVTDRGMDSVFVRETIPWNVAAGSTVRPVNIIFRNIGSCEWTDDALFNLRTLLNPFSAADIINITSTASVGTGETYTWPLEFTTTGSTGSLGTAWKVHRSSVKWIGDPMGTRMNWGNFPRWSTFVDSTIPQKVRAGSPFNFDIAFSNDGSRDWTEAENFGIWLVGPQTLRWDNNGQTFWPLASGETVSPGEIKNFNITPAADETPGIYNLTLRVVENGVGDFGHIQTTPVEIITSPKRVAEWTDSDIPTVVEANSTFPVSLEFTNHGIKSWLGSRGYQLQAIGGTAPFTAPATLPMGATETLLTGSSRTFDFNVTAPATPGTYTLTYRMAQDGLSEFGQYAKFDITVVDTNWDSRIISHTIPDTIAANDKALVEVVVRNEGTTPWTQGSLVRLGIKNDPAPFSSTRRVVLRSTEVTTTGETTCFQFSITAPNALVTETFEIQMIQDNGFGWFGETLVKDVQVISDQYGSELVNVSAPSTVTENENFTISITMRNTGARVWNDEDLFYMEERTTDVTPFIGSFRDYMDAYSRVENGEEYTFHFPLQAPGSAGGPFTLEFKVVDHGVARFGETVPVTISVVSASPPPSEASREDNNTTDLNDADTVTEYYVVDSQGGLHAVNGGSLTQLAAGGLPVVDAVSNGNSVLALDEQGVLYDLVEGDLGGELLGMPIARDVEVVDGEAVVLDGYGVVHGSSLTTGLFLGWDIARDLAATEDGSAYILDGYGTIHALNGAPALDSAFLGADQAVAVQLLADGRGGYVLDAGGTVYPLGEAADLGSADLEEPVAVDLVLTDSEAGYYILDANGGVTAFGDAAEAISPELDGAEAVGLLKVQR